MHLFFFLANYIPKCSASSPALKDCVVNSVNTLRPHLIKGELQKYIFLLFTSRNKN